MEQRNYKKEEQIYQTEKHKRSRPVGTTNYQLQATDYQ